MSNEQNQQQLNKSYDPYITVGNRRIKHRSTYTPLNALRWKPEFDKIIESGESRLITSTECNYYTLRTKVSDALRWLVDNYDKEISSDKYSKEDYFKLRTNVQFSIVDNGLMIKYNKYGSSNVGKAVSSTTLSEIKPEHKRWRIELEEFLAGQGGHSNPFFRAGIIISPDDKKEVEDMLANFVEYFEWNIKTTSITVARK